LDVRGNSEEAISLPGEEASSEPVAAFGPDATVNNLMVIRDKSGRVRMRVAVVTETNPFETEMEGGEE